MASPTVRRLMKEAVELSSSASAPSPHFHAHPVSDTNLYEWHFTLAGPPAPSPYAKGIYHGRIVLPPQYPLRPPSFRFLTPSGRFEVNREICLSISGHHEETWQPAWGIRTALIAIRSFMDGDAKGQLGGLDATEDARKEWAQRSRDWKCDGCGEGKTNAQVLDEWRALCREKGVVVDENGAEMARDVVPEELRMSYKQDKPEKAEDGTADRTPVDDPTPVATASKVATAADPSSPAVDPSQPSAQGTNAGSSVPAPAPTRTIPGPVPASASTVQRRQNTAASQAAVASPEESPWLDRAIIGVILALVFMVFRKLAAVDDDM